MNQSIVRKLDFQGRIYLPSHFRTLLGIEPDDNMRITLDKNRLIIEQERQSCLICGTTLPNHSEKPVCDKCLHKLCSE